MRAPSATDPLHADLLTLALILTRAWSAPSASEPHRWRPAAAEEGQCAATALVTQDIVGGTLRVGRLDFPGQSVSHCWNVLPDGREVDLTSRQLRGAVPKVARPLARRDLLAVPGVAWRYAYLAARVARLLQLEGIAISGGSGGAR